MAPEGGGGIYDDIKRNSAGGGPPLPGPTHKKPPMGGQSRTSQCTFLESTDSCLL